MQGLLPWLQIFANDSPVRPLTDCSENFWSTPLAAAVVAAAAALLASVISLVGAHLLQKGHREREREQETRRRVREIVCEVLVAGRLVASAAGPGATTEEKKLAGHPRLMVAIGRVALLDESVYTAAWKYVGGDFAESDATAFRKTVAEAYGDEIFFKAR